MDRRSDDLAVLGLPADAGFADIKRAWRRLAEANDPAQFKDREARAMAEKRLREVNAAYHRLSSLGARLKTPLMAFGPPTPARSKARRGLAAAAAALAVAGGTFWAWQSRAGAGTPAPEPPRSWTRTVAQPAPASPTIAFSTVRHPRGDFQLEEYGGWEGVARAIEGGRSLVGARELYAPLRVDRARGVLTGLLVRDPSSSIPKFTLHEFDLNQSGLTEKVVLRDGPDAESLDVYVYMRGYPDPAVLVVRMFGYTVVGKESSTYGDR